MPINPTTPPAVPSDTTADLRQLIETQGRQIAEMQILMQKIYTYIWWQRIMFVVKLLLIAVPLILGILYLPPLIEQVVNPYRQLLGPGSSGQEGAAGYEEEWQQYLYDLSR